MGRAEKRFALDIAGANRETKGMRIAESKQLLLVFGLGLMLSCRPSHASAVWPQFRGPNCAGVSDSDKPPVEFGPTTNLLWKTELPAGFSSPCVWEDRIF